MVVACLEALQLVSAESAVIKVDRLTERGGLGATQPAGRERQSDLQCRWAPRASLREGGGADWLRVEHALERE
eukprot:14097842-Alexandrium_andersonii.AAC.1